MITDEEAKEIKKQLLQQLKKFPEEQIRELKEKIEAMNNEELEDFIKEKTKGACIFCQIVSGQVKSYKIFEDENFIVVLDIMPASRGHTIILPKKHAQFLTQLTDDEIKNIFVLTKKIIPILINITKAKGISIYVAQGIDQKVPHFAINLIPRHEKDGLSFEWKKQPAQERELLDLSKEISFVFNKIIESEKEKKAEEKQKEEETEAQKLAKHVQERMP